MSDLLGCANQCIIWKMSEMISDHPFSLGLGDYLELQMTVHLAHCKLSVN